MADQGLPLMALPQQNLFGAAGDDLAGVLANRELAKRKQMLEDIKTQIEMQKSQNETNLANSTVQTASSQRRINEAKAPLDLDKLGGEVTKMADEHAKSLSDQQKQQSLRQAQDEFDAAQKAGDTVGMTRAGGKIVGYGGSLMTKDQADAINAPVYQQQIQEKLRAYATEKDPDKKMAIGMELANIPGAKGVPTPDATPFQFSDSGAFVGDTRTGGGHPTGYKPQGPASAGQYDQPTIDYLADQVFKQNRDPASIPAAAKPGVDHALALRGADIPKLTIQSKFMRESADSLLPQIEKAKAMAKQIDEAGLMGTVGGLWNKIAAGHSVAADLAGLSPEQQHLVGQFASGVSGLLLTGIARAHGGARAGGSIQMIDHLKHSFDPGQKSLDVFLGNMDEAEDWMKNYSQMGQSTENNPAGGTGAAAGGVSVTRDKDGKLVVIR